MIKLQIDFKGNNTDYSAALELDGSTNAWTALVNIVGHPTTKEMLVTYRLGEYLGPMFFSKADLDFFRPLLDRIDEEATAVLPKEELPLEM